MTPGSAEHKKRHERLTRLARMMDSSIRIPIIGRRIGWDAIIGLIPGIGDFAGAVISGYIVLGAIRLGAPRGLVARMIGNVGLETLIGAVPVLGDVFDMAFRANLRNVALLDKHLESVTQSEDEPSDAL